MSRSIRSSLNRWFRPTPVTVRRARLGVEALERREVPATLVNANTLTYQDVDGDQVTVKFSKPVLTDGNANSVFEFNTGDVNDSNATKQALWRIFLNGAAMPAGTTVTTTAVKGANGGDGYANLGELFATNTDVGAVTIDGDLGRILAGDMTAKTTGLNGLTVQSMGRFGTSTGAMDLHSVVQGKLTSLTVKGDVKDAWLEVLGGADGKIGAITISGSLMGGMMMDSGRIVAEGAIGAVTIKGDVNGGAGKRSGSLRSGGAIASMTIGGSFKGQAVESTSLWASGDVGPVKIGGDVVGGSGNDSGSVRSATKLTSVTIGGSILGGGGVESGRVNSLNELGAVTIGGDVAGGMSLESGTVSAFMGKLASIAVGGSVRGGGGESSGVIFAKSAGVVKITGDLIGGPSHGSGAVSFTGKVASLTIGGSIKGGDGEFCGYVHTGNDTGSIKIGGSVVGGVGIKSGSIECAGKVASVTIGGSLRGGTGDRSGSLYAWGEMKTVAITGDIVGGDAILTELEKSGFIGAKRINSLTVNSIVAGINKSVGKYLHNAAVVVADDLGTVLVKGSLAGKPGSSVLLAARGQANPTGTTDVAIGSLTVNGRVEHAHILAGYDLMGPKNADAQIGAVKVDGDWIATSLVAGASPDDDYFGNGDDEKIMGGGVKDNPAVVSKIKSVTIGGQALGTVNGTDHYGIVAEQVDAVKIGGTLLTLTAGAGNDAFSLGITGDFKVDEI